MTTTKNIIHVPNYMWTMRRDQQSSPLFDGWHHETLYLPDSDLGGMEFKSREQLEEEIHVLHDMLAVSDECERMMADDIQSLQDEVNKLRIEKNKHTRKELESKRDK